LRVDKDIAMKLGAVYFGPLCTYKVYLESCTSSLVIFTEIFTDGQKTAAVENYRKQVVVVVICVT